MAAAASPWTLSGRVAKLSSGEFSAAVDVERPGLGVQSLAWSGRPIAAIRHLLALNELGPRPSDLVRPIEDCYVRGRDLVAVYAESPQHPLRYVLYWRALGEEQLCGAAAGLDIVVSVQTSILDATPAAFLGSDVSAETVFRLTEPEHIWTPVAPCHLGTAPDAAGGASRGDTLLCDLDGSDWSYAEMIHPRDQMPGDELALDHPPSPDAPAAAPLVRTSHRVLGLRLEKGVLLRARLRAILAPRQSARDVALASRAQFHRAELPLTA